MVGFQEALSEHQIEQMVPCLYSASEMQEGYLACKQALCEYQPNAILAGTDEIAVGILKHLHENHLAVPDDIVLASIDNIDLSRFTIPSLTTVDIPRDQIGFHAIDILANRHKGASVFTITVPTQLVIRDSSIQRTLT